jgi:type IV pilus assembly protein PilP
MKNNSLGKNKWYFDGFYLGLMAILLSGCNDPGIADLEKYVAEIKAIENPLVEPIPEYRHIPPYFYEVQDQRDPFLPWTDANTKRPDIDLGEDDDGENPCPSIPDSNRVQVGLEEMPLDALQMVGTLKTDGILWALVVSKGDGILYQVKQNDYMGDNYGQIINISEEQIDILEQLPDGSGCWTQKVTNIRLATPSG